jgi:hypothetical protein
MKWEKQESESKFSLFACSIFVGFYCLPFLFIIFKFCLHIWKTFITFDLSN